MSFEVGVSASFTARHHLVGEFGPASQPHEHTYKVEVAVQGEALRSDGTLLDIVVLQEALRAVTSELDGADLNALPAFVDSNPTAEVVARSVSEQVAPNLAGLALKSLAIRVWESPEAYASYTGDLA
jgi:6-pyruvoyltetrahydropterin/6-carboxytetrahydropterin synthase